MVHGKNRIPYWIDRRLIGLAGPEYDAIISFGLPFEPGDSQYGKYRIYMNARLKVRDDSYLLHQMAVYDMNRPDGNLSQANELLTRAKALAPGDSQYKTGKYRLKQLRGNPVAKRSIRGLMLGNGGARKYTGAIAQLVADYGFVTRDGRADRVYLHPNNIEATVWERLLYGRGLRGALAYPLP